MPRKPRSDDPRFAPILPEFSPPPYFKFVRSARTLGHLVMRRAVLLPVIGRMMGRDPQHVLDRYLKRARSRWIELATHLVEEDLPPIACVAERLQPLLDCPPPFAFVYPQRPACGDASLCPSCWARAASARWRAASAALYGEAPRRGARLAGATLIVRALTYRVPKPPPSPAAMEDADGEGGTPPGWDGFSRDPDDYVPLAAFLDRRLSPPSRARDLIAFDDDPWSPPGAAPAPRGAST